MRPSRFTEGQIIGMLKEQEVAHACAVHAVGQRRACLALMIDRSTVRDTSTRPGDALLREAMKAMAGERRRGGRKRALGMRRPMLVPDWANARWSLDFLSDTISDGRRFRVLVIVDDYTRECLALVADTSLSGLRVARELDDVIRLRGRPGTIVSDNGTEFTSMAILRWCQETGVAWHYTAPGKPTQNAFVESFMYGRPLRCKVRDEGRATRGSGAFMYAACWCGPFS